MFSGFLPGDIGKLEMLEQITLGGNNFSGEIPPEIGCLPNLKILGIEENKITGSLPDTLFNISSLQYLVLGTNQLTRSIPWKIGNLTSLQVVTLYENHFTGMIPHEISNLKELQVLVLQSNNLNGLIPKEVFNITTLQNIDLSDNHIYGTLPSIFGNSLPNLEELFLDKITLSGSIPQSIGNCSMLGILSIQENQLSGYIPNSLGDLRFLTHLIISGNNLSSEFSSPEVSLITSLTKCRNLIVLQVNGNFLHGILPKSVGNFSSSLEVILAEACLLQGIIPKEIGNLSSLILIDFSTNDLEGIAPHALKGLQRLQRLRLDRNKLSEPISYLCELQSLGEIWLSANRISGTLPECIANLTSLRYICLDYNRMIGSIPSNLWNMKDLLLLNLSSNLFTGVLPSNIGNLKVIILVDLSNNKFFGNIPSTIGQLQSLLNLSLAHNNLHGQIPKSIGQMVSLQSLDLSHNNLTGSIPTSLQGIRYLDQFNVSFNKLGGEIPSNGPFRNFTSLSFLFNEALCGAPWFHVPPCNHTSLAQNGGKKVRRYILMGLGITAFMLVLIVGSVMIVLRRKKQLTKQGDLLRVKEVERISYYELLQATRGYSESSVLGSGSFGVVYKGVLNDGRIVAIKMFNEQQKGAFKSFDVECNILCNIRHRNLTKVLTSCSNQDFKALVIEYMPNGSFEKWLYSENCFLDLMQRLNIMIDVACALEYLHHGCPNPVVHCDLKPSNVLLDEDLVAHICDFGIAKLLCSDDSITFTRTLATMGYIAPEYGSEGQVSTRSDVYSYGIMLMEAFTKIKPSNEMFNEHMSLRSWVKESLPERLINIIDANLLASVENQASQKMECLSSILGLALKCSAESPAERIDIKEVFVSLQKIKLKLDYVLL